MTRRDLLQIGSPLQQECPGGVTGEGDSPRPASAGSEAFWLRFGGVSCG